MFECVSRLVATGGGVIRGGGDYRYGDTYYYSYLLSIIINYNSSLDF